MKAQTVLLIILSACFAFGIAFYFYKKIKVSKGLRWILISLRFLALFLGFLLLINPEFVRNSYQVEKASLILLVDASKSISNFSIAEETQNVLEKIITQKKLQDKFSIQTYSFSKDVQPLDSLTFDGKMTNIAKSLETIKETFANSNNAIVLISDGNQTYGQDYEFTSLGQHTQLNTIIVGDTTTYQDVALGRINSNRYAFLDNQFPLEVQILYSGATPIKTELKIVMEGQIIHRQSIALSSKQRSLTVEVLVKAKSTGIKTITFELDALDNEKNKQNNRKEIAIEVIDEKTTVAIISSLKHPDIGALKKAIESNEQRQVVLLSPDASLAQLNKVDVFILYQPDFSFEKIYGFINQRGGGVFTIAGTKTNWNFLKQKISGFSFESFDQNEEILPFKHSAFAPFDTARFTMNEYPPLEGVLGEFQFGINADIIAYQRIRGVNLEEPLFFVMESEPKQAFLMGENIWKWRLQEYRNSQEFSNFDQIIGKLIFYLSNSGKKERLRLDYATSYQNTSEAIIRASFFNKAYDFEPNANLNLSLKGQKGFSRDIPMLLKGNQYEADLSDLEKDDYTFVVSETSERISKSGQFKILDFDLEKQLTSANYEKMTRVAERNSGSAYYPNQLPELINQLVNDNRFIPVQKSTKNVVSLINFQILLVLIVLALATEWFIRKYNGLI